MDRKLINQIKKIKLHWKMCIKGSWSFFFFLSLSFYWLNQTLFDANLCITHTQKEVVWSFWIILSIIWCLFTVSKPPRQFFVVGGLNIEVLLHQTSTFNWAVRTRPSLPASLLQLREAALAWRRQGGVLGHHLKGVGSRISPSLGEDFRCLGSCDWDPGLDFLVQIKIHRLQWLLDQ